MGVNLLTGADLAEARALQEALMTASCQLHGPDSTRWDETTRKDIETSGPLHWSGPCRIQSATNTTAIVDAPAGGHTDTVTRLVCAVPWGTQVEAGWVLTVTGGGTDPALAGDRFAVTTVDANTVSLTARRFRAERIERTYT